MKWSIKRFKSVVFIVRQTRVLAYFPFATSSKCRSLFSTCFPRCLSLPTNNAMLESSFPARKNSRIFLQLIGIWYLPSAAIFMANEKHVALKCACDPNFGRSRWNNMACHERSINEIHFFDYLVIFRHYFTGDGKVSCILATISDWFPKLCRGFL